MSVGKLISRALMVAMFVALFGTPFVSAGDTMVGQVAPDFKLEDWLNGSGKTSLKECEGQLVLIEMWATW